MDNYFSQHLLHMFIICSSLMLFPYYYSIKHRPLLFRSFMLLLLGGSMIFTVSFPVHFFGLPYDFRTVLLVIASVYAGPSVTILLYVILILYRFLMNAPDILAYAVGSLPGLALIIALGRGIRHLSILPKMGAAIGLILLFNGLTFLFFKPHALILYWKEILYIHLLHGIVIAIYVYLVEFQFKFIHMEEAIQRSEKGRIVGEMAASVAHEIRNPLTVVRGFIQLLKENRADEAKRGMYLDLCLEELDRAEGIINDYLSLARPEPYEIVPIHLNEEIRHLANVLQTYTHYNNIRLEVIVTDEPLYVAGDRGKFRQAMLNLCKNAIEAMQDGGTLTLKVQHAGMKKAAITIIDTGIGMTDEQIDRLGLPYFSTKQKGTGLGTTVSFRIIDQMEGHILVHSQVGKGTTFHITFPRVQGEGQMPARASQDASVR